MELDDFDENELFIDNFEDEEEKNGTEKAEKESDSKNGNEMTEEQKKKLLESVWEQTEKEVKKKAQPRKPRPKLSEQELLAEKGLPTLKKTFDVYKFPEEMDPYEKLNLMLGKMEFWAHNLFPSMTFSDCLDRFERIGQKRMVKNAIRRLRIGMPLNDENVGKEDEEEEKEKKDGDNEKIDEDSDVSIAPEQRADSLAKNETDDDGEETDDLDSFFERIRKERGNSAERSVKKGLGPSHNQNEEEIDGQSSAEIDSQSDNSSSDIEMPKSSAKKRKKIIIDDDF